MRIAFFSPPFPSHLAVHAALAEGLVARGHECFLVGHPEVQFAHAAMTLAPIDGRHCRWTPRGLMRDAGLPAFPFGVRRMVGAMALMTESLGRGAPEILQRLGIDAVVSDQAESAGALVAEHCGLPFATVAAALPLNREPGVPLPVLDWPYAEGEQAMRRNRGGEWVADRLLGPLDRTIAAEAARSGCAPKRGQADCLSPLLEVSQLPAALDFPRSSLPAHFHAVGPIRPNAMPARPPSPLPPIAPDRPLVFASLGTLQGHRREIFARVARACRNLGAQLLVAHCGGLSPREASGVGADWVVDRVDQREALRRADAVVTHAGLNTVLDAVECGTPMLCLPLAFDQPGVAARVARSGAGVVLKSWVGSGRIETALRTLLFDDSARREVEALRMRFPPAGGASVAVDLIEHALLSRRAVGHQTVLAAE